MTRKQQRLYAIILVVLGAALAVGLSLFALRNNVTFFYSPSQIVGPQAQIMPPADRPFRLGGLVLNGSLQHENEHIKFTVSDNQENITVYYKGIVPALFREGQGVIALGKLNDDGDFIASQLMVKHDENYMPPEVARALEKNRNDGN